MSVNDFFLHHPDIGHRYFTEADVLYSNAGTLIDLVRRDWEGKTLQVAHIVVVAEGEDEVMEIPGDVEDDNAHLRPMRLTLRESRLPALLALLGLPGWKRIFVNEDDDAWWIRVFTGHGAGTAEG